MLRKFLISGGCIGLFLMHAALFPAIDAIADETSDPIGRPKQFQPGKQTTYAVWYDDGEWHVRTSTKDGKKKNREVFAGSVLVEGDRYTGDFQGLEKAKKAQNADWIFPHRDGSGFDFQFSTTGNADGLNFKPGPKATTVKFKLLVGGDDDAKKIMIGAKGVHPEKATFSFPAHPKK